MLTTFDADHEVLAALRAVAAVHAGEPMLSPSVTRRLIELVGTRDDTATPRSRPPE